MKNKFDLEQNGYIRIRNPRTDVEVRFHIKTEKERRTLYRQKRKRWLRLGQVIDGKVKLTSYQEGNEASRLYREMLNDPNDSRFSYFTYQQVARCNLCNRPLKNTHSVWLRLAPRMC